MAIPVSKVRNTMNKYINDNIYTVVTYVRPRIDNGYGKLVPDVSQAPVETTLGTARVSRRRLPDPIVTGSRTTYDYQDVYYLLATYDAVWLKKGIIFEYYGRKYKTKLPENRIISGAIAYKLCDLEDVTSADVGDYYGS